VGVAVDDEGFDEAFSVLFPMAYRVALRILGNAAEAEEAAAEAMARTLVRWRTVRAVPYRDAWVARVTTNLAIDTARRRKRVPIALEGIADPSEATAVRLALTAALAALPRRQREVISLRFLVLLHRAVLDSQEELLAHVRRRAAALRRRRWAGAVVAVLVVVAVFAVLLAVRTGQSRTQVVATASAPPRSEVSTTSSASGDVGVTDAPTTTPGGDATPTSASSDTSSSATTVVDPPVSDATIVSWAADDLTPDPGQLVTFVVRVHSRRPDTRLEFRLSDTQFVYDDEEGQLPCGTALPDNAVHTFRWAFRVGGRRDIPLRVVSCDGVRLDATELISLDVAPGTGPPNGPQLPVVLRAGQVDTGAGPQLAVNSYDMDGQPNEFVIDWGDGTPAQTVTVNNPCTYAPGDLEYSGEGYGAEPTHVYALAGTYHVHITVRSHGCDGGGPDNVQTAEADTDILA
jgi:RNA polymerase sigma-70 factor (ECF subfamily)